MAWWGLECRSTWNLTGSLTDWTKLLAKVDRVCPGGLTMLTAGLVVPGVLAVMVCSRLRRRALGIKLSPEPST